MPKTNTQNPNEQNRNTNTPNGANYTNPLQNEFENSATYRVIHKVGDKASRERRVFDLIEMVGLPRSVMDALPGQLSGGQRQRVAIARALALAPDAIIADEPTSALDVSVRAQILNLLMDLKRELNLSMVFISHDIQTVRYISDRIVVMNGGRAVEEGAAEQVFNNPTDDYTRLLLGAAPSLLYPRS